jgi:hypothetical protein
MHPKDHTMLTRLVTITALLLLPVRALCSGWIALNPADAPYTAPRVTVVSDDPSGTTLRIDIPGFAVGSLTGNGVTYQTVDLLTEASTTEPGRPEVPIVPRLLAVPDNGGVTVEVIESGVAQKFDGFLLPPARAPWIEGKPEPPYIPSAEAYASGAAYPAEGANVGRPVVFRDFRVARIAVHPLRYNARDHSIEAVPFMTVRVRYGAGPVINPRLTPRRPIAPSFGAIYRSVLANYQSVLDRDFGGIETGQDLFLCITPDTFATAFQPYAEWKRKTGMPTIVTKFSEIGANATNPDLIKNYLAQAYTTWEHPPTYVLLVGDYGKVPRKSITGYSYANEDYFVELAGDDAFPEMMIGRFTHDTDYRLQTLVSKAIRYEQAPYMVNTDWYRKATVCANDNYESQVYTKRFTAKVMLDDGHFTSVDTMMSKSPCLYSKTDVINAINQGRGWLNYRGEGWTDGWWASCTPLRTTDVSTLNNGQMLTFVTSIGCGVAMFDASSVANCFGEEWIELGTPTAPRGAVAFLGPTGNTHTTYNNKIDMGLYMGMFQEGLETPAQGLLRGKMYLYSVYGEDPLVAYEIRIYTTLGDPSIHIWKTVPAPIAVTYPSVVSMGFNQIEVEVQDSVTGAPVRDAVVNLTGDTLMVSAATDSTGRAILSFTMMQVDTLTLFVRGGAVIPKLGTVEVISDLEHVSPVGNGVVTDTDGNLDGHINPGEHGQITVTLKNWGSGPSTNVEATLSPVDSTLVNVVTTGPVSFGTLGSGSSATGAPFVFHVLPACQVGTVVEFDLWVSSTNRFWHYAVRFEVMGCRLAYVGAVVNDQGSRWPNARLDPGETAIVNFTINNTGEDAGPGVTGILRSTDSLITIVDASGVFGDVPAGGSAASTSNFFIVSVDDSCPLNSSPGFTLELQTNGGSYPYDVTRSFTIPVGTPLPADPTGPDAGGYYAYSSDDSLFEQAPKYEWFDIGAVGTQIPRNSNGDFTQTVTLPFSFTYYDTTYTQLRISSDGWVAFGSGTQVSYNNQPLPNDDNVTCMVAPFWDDLFAPGTSNTARLLYYNDAAHHRFIAQWDQVGHYSDSTDRETFQVILYDPAYFPTASGNGEFAFQYNTIVESSSMTVGIENRSENIGTQYVYNELYAATASPVREGLAIKFTTQPPTTPLSVVSISVGVTEGWNMIANPVAVADSIRTVRRLFPDSYLDFVWAFSPATGFHQDSLLETGVGYWGKFPANGSETVTGRAVGCDTVALERGWNLIGSISSLVDTAMLVTVPPGLRTSVIYGYESGYAPVRYLIPGRAHWFKAASAGHLIMGTPSALMLAASPAEGGRNEHNSLTIADALGRTQTLLFGDGATAEEAFYAMPPLPPHGAFDARFATEDGGTMLRLHTADVRSGLHWPIAVQSAVYPLTVSWNVVNGRTYMLADQSVAGHGSMRIAARPQAGLALEVPAGSGTPTEFALLRNYPNPFNPATTIAFALPVRSRVTVEIFNLIGQRVRTLLRSEEAAGMHTVLWDGTGDAAQHLGSGVYFLRIEAAGDNGRMFSAVQKLMMMK